MGGPEKPFCCPESGCGASFTNEDRLAVHAKKHDMVLQLGGKGQPYVADQTPTPTRFIRNCEEVGLFQDLQNVNPFDETFKRAMETRSSNTLHVMDSHLAAVPPDDTLHTPHIFPHLPDENVSGIYSTSTNTLTVSRLSSDEGTSHLTVVKCLSSSTEEREDLESSKKNKESTVPLKNRLKRQHSVDISDDIIPEYIDKNKDICGVQIPVISISETSNKDNPIVKNVTESNASLKVKCVKTLDVKSCLKSNYTKLISQKSIDMALINFQNEAHSNNNMDLNNISIEDLPRNEIDSSDLTAAIKASLMYVDSQNVAAVTSKDSSSQSERRQSFARLKLAKDKSKEECVFERDAFRGYVDGCFVKKKCCVNVTNTTKQSGLTDDGKNAECVNADMPVIETVSGESVAEVNSKDKGYELLLKWPNGTKVYLKEVFRQDDAVNNIDHVKETNECANAVDLKQRLRDVIKNNAKKIASDVKINECVAVPDDYVIMPNGNTSILRADKVAQYVTVAPTYYAADGVFCMGDVEKRNGTLEPIGSVKNVAIYPKPADKGDGILGVQSICDKRSLVEGVKRGMLKGVAADSAGKKGGKEFVDGAKKDAISKSDVQERNRAAVLRYRTKKKALNQMVEQKNSQLEQANARLTAQLAAAMAEVKRLRGLIETHAGCSITRLNASTSHLPQETTSQASNIIHVTSSQGVFHGNGNSNEHGNTMTTIHIIDTEESASMPL